MRRLSHGASATITGAALSALVIGVTLAGQAPAARQGSAVAAPTSAPSATAGRGRGAGELMATLERWYQDADAAKTGSISPEQLTATLNAAFPAPPPAAGRGAPACGGNSPTKTPCPEHVAAMTAALPAKAPADLRSRERFWCSETPRDLYTPRFRSPRRR
jgi:hypothetical protein